MSKMGPPAPIRGSFTLPGRSFDLITKLAVKRVDLTGNMRKITMFPEDQNVASNLRSTGLKSANDGDVWSLQPLINLLGA
jgi:hypothetical protein